MLQSYKYVCVFLHLKDAYVLGQASVCCVEMVCAYIVNSQFFFLTGCAKVNKNKIFAI